MGATRPASPGSARANHTSATAKEYVNWFEVPAYDLARAKAFFDHVFGISMETHFAGDYAMAYFPMNGSSGGAVVQGPGCIPNDCGALLYLNAGEDLDGMLARVEEAGGRVVMGRTLISEQAGSFALFVDSEGNRLALHEKPATRVAKSAAEERPKRSTERKARKTTTARKPAARKKAKKTARGKEG